MSSVVVFFAHLNYCCINYMQKDMTVGEGKITPLSFCMRLLSYSSFEGEWVNYFIIKITILQNKIYPCELMKDTERKKTTFKSSKLHQTVQFRTFLYLLDHHDKSLRFSLMNLLIFSNLKTYLQGNNLVL